MIFTLKVYITKLFVLFFAGLVYVIKELRTKQLSKNYLRVLSSSKHAKFRVKWDSEGENGRILNEKKARASIFNKKIPNMFIAHM